MKTFDLEKLSSCIIVLTFLFSSVVCFWGAYKKRGRILSLVFLSLGLGELIPLFVYSYLMFGYTKTELVSNISLIVIRANWSMLAVSIAILVIFIVRRPLWIV